LHAKGHEILHLRCTDYITGNADFSTGDFKKEELEFRGISAGFLFNRYKLSQRLKHETVMSGLFFSHLKENRPDYVILSNLPLLTAFLLTKKMKKNGLDYIYWWQDVYSLAIYYEIKARFKISNFGIVKRLLTQLERFVLLNSVGIVAISEKFLGLSEEWKFESNKVVVFPNWSPPEDFSYARADDIFRSRQYFLYAGTLGLKHNPELLLQLAESLERDFPAVQIIVISQGLGRDFLEKKENIRQNLILMDFVPFSELQKHLQGAIGVIAILEPSASDYSVPSKIMTYFCAGKPIIAAFGSDNQAASYISSSNSGYVVDSQNYDELESAAYELIRDPSLRKSMGMNAREFAEKNFSGEKAADIFLKFMVK
jgi:glycosyltransferase involved in cell wall biosynthesis